MAQTDPRVDAYIRKAAPFARPILERLREAVHAGCPDVQEEMKWNSPHFAYKGMFCGMAAFKEHCIFGFWKHKLLADAGLLEPEERGVGQYGCIRSVADLPSDKTLITLVKAAAKFNDAGIKVPRVIKKKPPLKVPAALTAALRKNAKARATFQGFSTSAKREYVEWLDEAKTDATLTKRLATAVEWMAEGKIRNWKYVR